MIAIFGRKAGQAMVIGFLRPNVEETSVICRRIPIFRAVLCKIGLLRLIVPA
jgi:hypothetical protein